jgi:hypothetical protein
MRALASGELRGIRDNRNAWQIDDKDLTEWSASRPGPVLSTHRTAEPDPVRTTPLDTPETLARLASAETRADLLATQLEDVKSDRDAWRTQAELLSKGIEGRSGGFWTRLFRS